MILPDQSLRIIDRKKNIFKLAQGEYIAPEKIENILVRSPFVAQVFVYGDSLQSCLVGIIVPEEEYLRKWISDSKLIIPSADSFRKLASAPSIKEVILSDIQRLSKEAKLNGFEMIKDIHIEGELMTIENGLLTPSMKMKRVDVAKRFQNEIASMYGKIAASPKAKL